MNTKHRATVRLLSITLILCHALSVASGGEAGPAIQHPWRSASVPGSTASRWRRTAPRSRWMPPLNRRFRRLCRRHDDRLGPTRSAPL